MIQQNKNKKCWKYKSTNYWKILAKIPINNSYHILINLIYQFSASDHSFLFSSNRQFIFGDARRRQVDSDVMLVHHLVNHFVISSTNERMVWFGNFKYFISLFTLYLEKYFIILTFFTTKLSKSSLICQLVTEVGWIN